MSDFCKPYGLDRCSNGGGLKLYIRQDITSRLLAEYKPTENVECFYLWKLISERKYGFFVAHIILIK